MTIPTMLVPHAETIEILTALLPSRVVQAPISMASPPYQAPIIASPPAIANEESEEIVRRPTRKQRKLTSPPSDSVMANDDDIADAFSSPANKNSKSSLSARSKSAHTSKSGYQRPPYIT
jgi:hypothetical protein